METSNVSYESTFTRRDGPIYRTVLGLTGTTGHGLTGTTGHGLTGTTDTGHGLTSIILAMA